MENTSVESIIGYKFSNKALLENAFIHSSYANEHKGKKSNERLEFLGDSVLSIVVTDQIYHHFNKKEGDLSKIRASLVSEKSLANIMKRLSLGKFLKTGAGIKTLPTDAMLADCFEALTASIYLDGGIEQAKKFVLTNLESAMLDIEQGGVPDSNKSALQEKMGNANIVYKTTSQGEPPERIYTSRVYVNGVMCGIGSSTKKRFAEELSAKEALKNIKTI